MAAFLEHPDAVRFSENLQYVSDWKSSGGRLIEQPSGHRVFYGRHGRRILLTDPEGHPLHECLWKERDNGEVKLVAARLWLDWGQWVGIKPEGLVNTISLDLSRKPGWERLTRDDLRQMAARSMQTDMDTITFFYRDEDLLLHKDGKATIRQVKDAFYVLPHGVFEEARFMSCMSRMEWGRINYLPVVELFLSLLPGTGSATFELIRGLYDDQNPDGACPLFYRGIPVYPSEAAFRLFSLFFAPSLTTNELPLPVFLDPQRSQEVRWLPASDYPVRYVDQAQRLCVTIKQHTIQKATVWDDPSGLAYSRVSEAGRPVSDNRGVYSADQRLIISDGPSRREFIAQAPWQLSESRALENYEPFPSTWRDCFPKGAPSLQPAHAFAAVLLYPDRQELIGEKESQPFVFDFLDDFFEEQPELRVRRAHAKRVLLAHCEAALASCIEYQHPQHYTIWYAWPEFAQKYAQGIWNQLARRGHLAWLSHFQFLPYETRELEPNQERFDWINLWIPFADYPDPRHHDRWSTWVASHLTPGSLACIAGPSVLGSMLQQKGLQVLHAESGADLPTFRIHQTILPYGWINPDLIVWIVQKD